MKCPICGGVISRNPKLLNHDSVCSRECTNAKIKQEAAVRRGVRAELKRARPEDITRVARTILRRRGMDVASTVRHVTTGQVCTIVSLAVDARTSAPMVVYRDSAGVTWLASVWKYSKQFAPIGAEGEHR